MEIIILIGSILLSLIIGYVIGKRFRMKSNEILIKFEETEGDVRGSANMDGTVIIDKDISLVDFPTTLLHEIYHIYQIRSKKLRYSNNFVFYNGKVYDRRDMKEGAPNLPWEIGPKKLEEAFKSKNNIQ